MEKEPVWTSYSEFHEISKNQFELVSTKSENLFELVTASFNNK